MIAHHVLHVCVHVRGEERACMYSQVCMYIWTPAVRELKSKLMDVHSTEVDHYLKAANGFQVLYYAIFIYFGNYRGLPIRNMVS